MKNDYYVYEWYNVDTEEVFYVGKGRRYRYNEKKYGRNIYFRRYIEKYTCDVRKVVENLSDEDACEKEIELILYYKQIGQAMCNISKGGETGNGLFGENHPLSIPIVQLDLKGNFIREWVCVAEAQKTTGLKSIFSTIEGKSERCGAFMWFTKEYYEENKHNIKPYRNKQGDYNKLAVIQLDIEGNYIDEFTSMSEAERKTGSDHRHVSECCRGKRKICNNFRWIYKNEYLKNNCKVEKLENIKFGKPRRIVQVTLEGEYIKTWESAYSIERELGISNSQIIGCCKEKRKTARNFKWIYEEKYLVESR